MLPLEIAIGKCQNQVPTGCMIGAIPTTGISSWGWWCSFRLGGRKRPSLAEVRSPTLRRRQLGAMLRTLRLARDLTVEQVAERLLCSPSKVSRMETGHRGATQRDIRDLCDFYGITDQAVRDQMSRLAAEGRQQGWWQSYELDYFATYVDLEAAAVHVKYYQSTIVPGLLQTTDYTRAMNEAVVPAQPPERIDEQIEVKQKRQMLLTQEPPLHMWAVMDEATLHRVVGGPDVMTAQLDRLIEVTQLPGTDVTIQIIPYGAGAHPAMDSTFNILEFGDPSPRVVYVEGLVGSIYVERPQDVHRYEQVFDRLQQMALSPQESAELVARMCAKYRSSFA